jgi:hypothetical protein
MEQRELRPTAISYAGWSAPARGASTLSVLVALNSLPYPHHQTSLNLEIKNAYLSPEGGWNSFEPLPEAAWHSG